ncbi:MAG: type I restriction enzyme S subunit, partial [Cognaticolwellia sp.]
HINAISLEDYITGTAQPKMNQAKMNSIVVAIPPEAEQHRIVAKVDELMALCDQLEQQTEESLSAHQTLVEVLLSTLTESKNAEDFQTSWQRIAEYFDLLFTTEQSIEQLKQTILQLAVMGKLVPQNASDEPASVLLEKIAEEKAQLIADKKIKKQKPLPLVTDEEEPFEQPKGWEFERLGNCSNVFSGNSFKSGDFNNESGTRVIKITNAGVGALVETDDYLPTEFLSTYENYKVFEGDLILALTRPYISTGLKISICPSAYNLSLLNQRVAAIRPYFESTFLYLFLSSNFVLKLYQDRFSGSGLQPNLKMGDVTELVIPIVPLAEQHRIVAKVDELIALCEQLKARLIDAQTTQLNLADAVAENALNEQAIN